MRGDIEEKLRFTQETLAQFCTVEDVAMFATTVLFSVIPTHKIAVAVLEGNTLKSVSTIGRRVFMDLTLDQPSINARSVKTRRTQLANDTREDPDYFPGDGSDSFTMLSELCVPMVNGGEVVGTINFENLQAGYFSQEDAETAEAFAREITGAIHRVSGKNLLGKGPQAVYQVKTRSTMDRYHDLLRAVHEGETVMNRILNRTVIPWKPGREMVDNLVAQGYLARKQATARRYTYHITEEGVEALEVYQDMLGKLGKREPEPLNL